MSTFFGLGTGALGGLGLFLLGMWMMTEGLKLAGGNALQRILGNWTSTSLRGFAPGTLLTALVQSSSGVTVATIGFVNAGLLTFSQSLWVIFGSNVGTTMTGWIVAIFGFNFKIEAFALPMLGVGIILHLFARSQRVKAFGGAIAGFGLLFLGIDVLKETFVDLGKSIDLRQYLIPGITGQIVMVAIGVLMTLLMQSSSAAIAIVITAVGGGVLPLQPAAAVIIGANIGTTSTAILSAIGATANARRIAAAHVIFNLITGLVALMILPFLLDLLGLIGDWKQMARGPTASLALFHTTFNILGVILMIPITGYLAKWLSNRFMTLEDNLVKPRFLDANVAHVPDLALQALDMELKRLGRLSIDALKAAVSIESQDISVITKSKQIIERLSDEIYEFITLVTREKLTADISEQLTDTLTVTENYRSMIGAAEKIAGLQALIRDSASDSLDIKLNSWLAHAIAVVEHNDTSLETFDLATITKEWEELDKEYKDLKLEILRAGVSGTTSIREMEHRIELSNFIRQVLASLLQSSESMVYLNEFHTVIPVPATASTGTV